MVDPDLALSALGYPRRGLHGRVVDQLGRHVVGGRWSAGAPMPREEELAAELGVSRTVVRESIKVLQSKGLVEVRPKTGTRVRARRAWHLLDADVVAWQFADMARADDVDELQEIRIAIEVAGRPSGRRAAHHAQLAEIEANERRIQAAADEPLARTVAELDFHRADRRRRAEHPARPCQRDDPHRARGDRCAVRRARRARTTIGPLARRRVASDPYR